MGKKRLTVHMGCYKTGTSYLQLSIFGSLASTRKSLENDGLWLYEQGNVAVIDNRAPLYRRFVEYLAIGADEQSEAAFEQALTIWLKIKAHLAPYDSVFISDEHLGLGQLGLPHRRTGNYIHIAASTIVELMSEYEITIVYSIRCQDGYFESAYSNAVKHGYDRKFQDYLASIDIDGCRWSAVLGKLSTVENVHAVYAYPYEALKHDSAAFITAIASRFLFGLPIMPMKGEVMRSLTQKAIDICLIAAPILNNEERFELGVALNDNPYFSKGGKAVLLTDTQRSKIRSRYYADNQAVFERYMHEEFQQYLSDYR